MSILKAIKNAYATMESRGWDKIYFFFDLHGTVIKPNYEAGNIPTEFYPYAEETLKILSEAKDVCIIMYTCSHPHEIEQYKKMFESKGIFFEYINENPEVKTDLQGYGCYDTKPYINALFDDKAGFDGDSDWEAVYYTIVSRYNKKSQQLEYEAYRQYVSMPLATAINRQSILYNKGWVQFLKEPEKDIYPTQHIYYDWLNFRLKFIQDDDFRKYFTNKVLENDN